MLEHDLIELFELQAAEEPPAAHASVTAASRHGRSRLRRRWAVSVAAPVLAAAAVLAVAVSGTLTAAAPAPTSPASTGPAQGQVRVTDPHLVPPLFFWPGWLPRGMHVDGGNLSAPEQEQLFVKNAAQEWNVTAFTAGGCILKPSALSCAGSFAYPRTGSAGIVHGFPAYWSDGQPGNFLIFEWARDQWAAAQFPTHQDDLRVARNLTARVPAIRYPVQLTGRWTGVGIPTTGFTFRHGLAVVDGLSFGTGTALKAPAIDQVDIGVGPTGRKSAICGHGGTAEVIGGYPVIDQLSAGQTERICGYDVKGQALIVMASGPHLFASARAVFVHLRVFGLNPAKWPTTPIS
jgi:hypothetical protein